jgi:hypothetical protein
MCPNPPSTWPEKNKLFWAVNITFTHLQNKMLSAQQNKHARGAELSCLVIEHGDDVDHITTIKF